ncbi:DMT family transporter [Craterilacuibacter sp.]|uniref:DMT family transporter n=1 Tax=Craterilacuibacter sp. TaxID=2870909 RepID=UPI003F39706F
MPAAANLASRLTYPMLVLAILMWASNFIIGRALGASIGPFTLALLRWVLALLCLLPFAWSRLGPAWPAIRSQWKVLLFLGLSGIALTNTLLYISLRHTTATNAVVLNSLTPVMVLLLGTVASGQALSRKQGAGMLLALGGALIIVLRGDWLALARFELTPGDAGVVAAGACWACYTVGLRRLKPGIAPVVQMVVLFAIGVLALLPLALYEGYAGRALHGLTGGGMLALVYLGIFPSVLAFLMYNRAIAVIGSARAASFLYLMPAFGALLSILFLGERVYAYHVAGLATIFSGIAVSALPTSFYRRFLFEFGRKAA